MTLATAIESWPIRALRGARAAGGFIRADRRRMFGLAALVLGLGLALDWGWLVAIGVAPLIVSALPCVAMCALGLCMSGGGRSCAEEPSAPQQPPLSDAASVPTPMHPEGT